MLLSAMQRYVYCWVNTGSAERTLNMTWLTQRGQSRIGQCSAGEDELALGFGNATAHRAKH
jgi:hypothetical protein